MDLRTLVVSLVVVAGCSSIPIEKAGTSSGDPWADLVAGNERFVAGVAQHPHQSVARRDEVAKGQTPPAIVLTCSDSRVAPEFAFDQGLGDLFVVRVAGNVADSQALGSMEYAAEHLHSSLLVVMGHERCGAVQATLDGGAPHGHVESLVKAIKPALAESKHETGDALDDAVRANVRHVVAFIRRESPVLAHLEQEGKLRIVGARYDLDTGEVTPVE